MDFAIGKGQSLFPEWMRINVEVRLILESNDGRQAVGCSADWPSFGWLDKRPEIGPKQKLEELLSMVLRAQDTFAQQDRFENPFDAWWTARSEFYGDTSVEQGVPLCSSFCIALFERALIDAYCRIERLTFFDALAQNRLGLRPDAIHAELKGFDITKHLPNKPLDSILIRHTVGPNDPIDNHDVPADQQLNDGLPQTLQEYASIDGICSFKVKICGNAESDQQRLQRIWHVVRDCNPIITLDGNEAYDNTAEFKNLVVSLINETPDLFESIRFIEQPLSRATTFDVPIQTISASIPLIIDEADGHLHAFSDAIALGYQGVSHKNCKGIFKSLGNFALSCFRNQDDAHLFQSAEDLTSMPTVALHQDFVVIAALGLSDAERNAHHFFYGLSHLTDHEKTTLSDHYFGLYHRVDDQWFMKIDDGRVDISSLNSIHGLGVATEPDWSSMTPLRTWLADFQH